MKNTEFNNFIDKKFDELSNKRKTLLAKLNTQKLFMIALIFLAVGLFFLTTFIIIKNIPAEILCEEDIALQNRGIYVFIPFFTIAFVLSIIFCIFSFAKSKEEKTKSTLRKFYVGYKKNINGKRYNELSKTEQKAITNYVNKFYKIIFSIFVSIFALCAMFFIIMIISSFFETGIENTELLKYARILFGIVLFVVLFIAILSSLYAVTEYKSKTDEEKISSFNVDKLLKRINKK